MLFRKKGRNQYNISESLLLPTCLKYHFEDVIFNPVVRTTQIGILSKIQMPELHLRSSNSESLARRQVCVFVFNLFCDSDALPRMRTTALYVSVIISFSPRESGEI